jgi:transposase
MLILALVAVRAKWLIATERRWTGVAKVVMARGYSEAGESAREAARLLNIGASTAIRWIERWMTTGSVDAKPGTGHSRSPLERHTQWLLDLERIPFDVNQKSYTGFP